MELAAIVEAVGTPGIAWLLILFAGVLFWAFRGAKRRRSAGASRPEPGNDDSGKR